jgi:predicted dehydrogenase
MHRVVLIGFGYAGRVIHAPLIRATPGLELIAVGSTQRSRVRAELPDTPVLPPEAAVQHRSADLVVIATPNDTHAPLAIAALESRKHVVVDKPFTLSLDAARSLAALAAATERTLAVFQNRRWDGDFLGAREQLIERHAVGEIVHFESHFDRYRPEVRDRWREQAVAGSGVWYDLGPHLVDQALQLFGVPDRVIGQLAAVRPGALTDDWAHVMLEYSGLRVVLHASMLASGPMPRFVVHGQAGSWIKYGLDVQESQLTSGMQPGSAGWGEGGPAAILIDGATGNETNVQLPPGDWRQFYIHLRDALDGTAPNPVTPAQAIAVMAVLETAMQSSAEGRALPPPLSDEERHALV